MSSLTGSSLVILGPASEQQQQQQQQHQQQQQLHHHQQHQLQQQQQQHQRTSSSSEEQAANAINHHQPNLSASNQLASNQNRTSQLATSNTSVLSAGPLAIMQNSANLQPAQSKLDPNSSQISSSASAEQRPPVGQVVARKRGRRRQQAIPEQANGLDRVFVWDIDGSLVRSDTIADSHEPLEPSVLTSVQDKLGALAKRLKELTLTFCDEHLYLAELETAEQMHIDDVAGDECHQRRASNSLDVSSLDPITTCNGNNQNNSNRSRSGSQMDSTLCQAKFEPLNSSSGNNTSNSSLISNHNNNNTDLEDSKLNLLAVHDTNNNNHNHNNGFAETVQSSYLHEPSEVQQRELYQQQQQSDEQLSQHHLHLHLQHQQTQQMQENSSQQQQHLHSQLHPAEQHHHQHYPIHTAEPYQQQLQVNPSQAHQVQHSQSSQLGSMSASQQYDMFQQQMFQPSSNTNDRDSVAAHDYYVAPHSTFLAASNDDRLANYPFEAAEQQVAAYHYHQPSSLSFEQPNRQVDAEASNYHHQQQQQQQQPQQQHAMHESAMDAYNVYQLQPSLGEDNNFHQLTGADFSYSSASLAGEPLWSSAETISQHQHHHHQNQHHQQQHQQSSQAQLASNYANHYTLSHHSDQFAHSDLIQHQHQSQAQLHHHHHQHQQHHQHHQHHHQQHQHQLQQQPHDYQHQQYHQQQQHHIDLQPVQVNHEPLMQSQQHHNQQQLSATNNQSNPNKQQQSSLQQVNSSSTLRHQLNNHHKQVTHKLSMRFNRIRNIYNLNRQASSSSNGLELALKPTSGESTLEAAVGGQRLADLQEILAEIDHYTLDWRRRSIDCLRLISESKNCTNVIVTKLPLVLAFAHLVCLGLSQFFEVDQVYSANKSSKESCIKRIKKRFGATNRCSYIIVGDRDDVEMAKRLDLPSWNTSQSDGHRQLLQLYTALKEGYLM